MKDSNKKMTPLMKQYWGIKEKNMDSLLLFRMGDFYELFGEDAETAAPVIGIALTQRNKKSGDNTSMCGFPHHAMEGYVNKLLEEGFRVAVCDQVEDPAMAKGLVKREVTLKLSPGVVYNPENINRERSHYIFGFSDKIVCWYEPSTGKAFWDEVESFKEVLSHIERVQPAEIIVSSSVSAQKSTLRSYFLSDYLGDKLDPRDQMLEFVRGMQGEEALFSFKTWEKYASKQYMSLPNRFFKHLEIFESNSGDEKKSLFNTIKRTRTPGGARLLREWMQAPLCDLEIIKSRSDGLKSRTQDYERLQKTRKLLGGLGDLERRIARAGHSLGSPQDLNRLKNSLSCAVTLGRILSRDWLFKTEEIVNELESALEEETQGNWQQKGGYIKRGYSSEMDELISLSDDSQSLITGLELREKEATGIPTLKVRYNNVFGYYIEVTKTHSAKVPENYIRKQTLTSAERYTTEELSQIEEKVLTAQTKRLALERRLFEKLKSRIRDEVGVLSRVSKELCEEDVLSAVAYLSIEKSYGFPEFNDKDFSLEIKNGFHPVVMENLEKGEYVANDIFLSRGNGLLITGPNMAGKSTLMRQVALSCYLAQCGFCVPAESAKLPLYDGIFTRIGASDLVSEGLSTFMVEMQETAEILELASPQSLIIMDEIGRGTSSKDGFALAKGILDHILKQISCHFMFATHYHDLSFLEAKNSSLQNIHMAYTRENNKIRFLYRVADGAAESSYGIEVAKLAGLPPGVIKFAEQESKASTLEVSSSDQLSLLDFSESPRVSEPQEQSPEKSIKSEIGALKINEMTPMDALNKLWEWHESFS